MEVLPMEITRKTASTYLASSAGSVTATSGGESTITRSQRPAASLRTSCIRSLPRTSAGLGGIGPAASTSRPSTLDVWTASAREDSRSEEHTSELQSQSNLVCRLLLEKKKKEKTHKNTLA